MRKWLRWDPILNGLFKIAQQGTEGLLRLLNLNGKGTTYSERSQRRLHFKPSFEILEERQLLATRVWDGGGADSLFSNAENWSNDIAPDTGDIVFFDGTATKDAVVDTGWTGANLEDLEIRSGYTGTITWERDLTVTDDFIQSGGTVAGSYDLIVSSGGSFTWAAGAQTGAGTTFVSSGATLTLDTGVNEWVRTLYLQGGRTLENRGTGVILGDGTLRQDDPWQVPTTAILLNVGTLDLQGALRLDVTQPYNGAALLVDNRGTLAKTGESTATLALGTRLVNSGVVNVEDGTLRLEGGGLADGDFDVSSGAVLAFASDYALEVGSDVGGAGQVSVTAGTIEIFGNYDAALTVVAGGSVAFEENNVVAALRLEAGWVGGDGTLTVTDSLLWTGGGFTGMGKTVIEASATLTLDTGVNEWVRTLYLQGGRTLENRGTGVILGDGTLRQDDPWQVPTTATCNCSITLGSSVADRRLISYTGQHANGASRGSGRRAVSLR